MKSLGISNSSHTRAIKLQIQGKHILRFRIIAWWGLGSCYKVPKPCLKMFCFVQFCLFPPGSKSVFTGLINYVNSIQEWISKSVTKPKSFFFFIAVFIVQQTQTKMWTYHLLNMWLRASYETSLYLFSLSIKWWW